LYVLRGALYAGEEISRPLDDVIAEITSLAKQGVREINLLGQNVNAYRGEMDDGDIADFALLLHYVAAVEGIDRIRFTTSHPMEFTDELIEAFCRNSAIGRPSAFAGTKRQRSYLENDEARPCASRLY
jgi:tRNA-i(6)A37 thiotransferase enzyme MiaB